MSDASGPRAANSWHGLGRDLSNHGASGPVQREQKVQWSALCQDGSVKLAVGASFSNAPLAAAGSNCQILHRPPQNLTQWRDRLADTKRPDLILVDRSIWESSDFVCDGLAQLCHHLKYQGHFLWTNPPTRWPQSAQTRARILRLCSLHGLMLLGNVRLEPDRPDQSLMVGTLLWRRCPIRTIEETSG